MTDDKASEALAPDRRPVLPQGGTGASGPDAARRHLRDQFAGIALAGVMRQMPGAVDVGFAARRAYEIADAMLTAREAKP